MKSELAALVEGSTDSKNATELAPPRTRRGKRRSAQATTSNDAVRFFLSKSENNSAVPVLDREFANESEAIVESLKTGKSYLVVSEWKGLADLSKKMPLIRKEAVTRRKQNTE